MLRDEVLRSIQLSERQRRLLLALRQPMTAKQMAVQTSESLDYCCSCFSDLAARGFLKCLNPKARRSRLFWLTREGESLVTDLCLETELPVPDFKLPEIDWELYGWLCYSHRAAVLRALTEPLQPAAIKRRARARDPNIRMSANNVRDVIRLFKKRGIVRPVRVKGKHHWCYELSELGRPIKKPLMAYYILTATTSPQTDITYNCSFHG